MKTALTIAGSDCSGGAGIQADLKTMTMNGVYAMSAITALTAQNTTGVRAIQVSTPDFLKQQIDAVFEDIYPDAVKIGMVASSELIRVIADRLKYACPTMSPLLRLDSSTAGIRSNSPFAIAPRISILFSENSFLQIRLIIVNNSVSAAREASLV